MSLFDQVIALLRDRSISTALIGAEALAIRGVSRATLDRDLMTTDPHVLDEKLWKALSETGVRIDIRHGDDDDPLAGVVRIRAARERPIDLIVGRYPWQTRILKRSETLKVGDHDVAVPRTADLILLKLYAGGPQDAWDIAQLLETETRIALAEEVETLLPDLPAEACQLWRRILAG